MFTCCPQCETVFRVTANQLRAARGDVRCGNCAHVFNAMEFLADELPRLEEEESQPAMPTDDSLEFDAPEQTWGEIFIAAPPQPGDIALDGELEAITANPDEWRSMLAELGVEPGDVNPDMEDADEGIEVAAASLMPEDEADTFLQAAEPADEIPETVFAISDPELAAANDGDATIDPGWVAAGDMASDIDQSMDAGLPAERETFATAEAPADTELDPDFPPWDELEPGEEPVVQRGGGAGWALAAVVLAITLLVQLGHQSRDRLAAHPRYGELVRNTYQRIGRPLYPDWSLDAFYVRRSEALAGGSAPNALDINAAVEVTGAQSVGLPLVRVTLRDQWSNTVGRRVFLPEEYLASDLPDIVPPGTRIPVMLSLADPGAAARGYEVDLCLQRRRTGLECQLAERPYRP